MFQDRRLANRIRIGGLAKGSLTGVLNFAVPGAVPGAVAGAVQGAVAGRRRCLRYSSYNNHIDSMLSSVNGYGIR